MKKTEPKVKSKRIYYYHIDDLGILYKYITQKDKKFCGSDFENVHIRDSQGYGLSMYEPQSVSRYPRTFEALKRHLIEEQESWINHWEDEFTINKINFGASRKENTEHKNFIKKELEHLENLKNTKNYSEIDRVYNEWTFTKEFVECLKEDYGSNCFDFRNEDKSKESKVEIND
jgi:hypothetical protein